MSVGVQEGNCFGNYLIGVSITPASVAATTAVEQSFTVTGVKVGDYVDVAPPSDVAGVTAVLARVTAANTVGIKFVNPTAGGVVPAAGVYMFSVIRPSGGSPAAAIGA